nr:cytochrome P450 3045C6-2 [Brachionus rubens]
MNNDFFKLILNLYTNWISLVIKTFFTLASATAVVYLGKIWYAYRFFNKRGLKGPQPEFFYGNYREIRKNRNYSEVIRDWTKKYGKTYGYFEGHQPVLVTSDLDIIQQVFIKQTSNFNARKRPILDKKEDDPGTHLVQSTNGRWKRMRMIINPTFSSSKLRELSPLLVTCTERLIDCLDKEKETEINITQYFKRFTMDSIWNCAFGVDINMQYQKENEYFNKCEQAFSTSSNFVLPFYLGVYFHELRQQIMQCLMLFNRVASKFVDSKRLTPFYWLRTKVSELVKIRQNDATNKKKDFIQLLMDAKADPSEEKNFNYSELSRKLTMKEIEANLVLFMLAGYETTSTTLSYASYILSIHPEEQVKLYEEITSQFGTDKRAINYEEMQNLEYLDWFIKEVLRMYPIANAIIARRCTQATTIKGIDIPVDLPIAVDVMTIHFDHELWGPVDTSLFYPPRHSVKRNPLSFLSFGIGPRNCIGMKFAMKELKIALVNLILNFEFHKEKSFELEIDESVVRIPKNGVKVILKKRDQNEI